MNIPKQLILLIAISLLAISGCLNRSTVVELGYDVPSRKVEIPSNNYMWVVWSEQQGLVIFIGDGRTFVSAINDENRTVNIRLPNDPLCTRATRYNEFRLLPDNRLGLIKGCLGRWPDKAVEERDEKYLLAYDWNTGQLNQLVEGKLPSTNLSLVYTWNPDMSLGVQDFNGLSGTIYWISPQGFEPMDVTVKDGFRSWNLAENFDYLGTLEGNHVGIARAPAWSPDGNTIAFMANLDAIGVGGIARGDGEYQIYLMSPDNLSPRMVLSGIYNVTRMSWSPDGEWLAFYGYAGRSRIEGLWMFSPEMNELVQVAPGKFSRPHAWAPLGDHLAGIKCINDFCDETEVWVFDVIAIVSEK